MRRAFKGFSKNNRKKAARFGLLSHKQFQAFPIWNNSHNKGNQS
jgi:hypothetical protein